MIYFLDIGATESGMVVILCPFWFRQFVVFIIFFFSVFDWSLLILFVFYSDLLLFIIFHFFFSFDFSFLMLFVSYSDSGAAYQNGCPRFEGWAKFPYDECC